jgi:hypothetical protein
LLAGVAASVAALLAVPSLTPLSAAEEVFVSAGHVTVPGSPLAAFDISWIDPDLVEYMLADRSNAAVDVIPLILNPPVFPIKPTGINAFAGATGNNDTSGPNGILTFNDPQSSSGKQLWVGDGPTNHPSCGQALPCSTVKVFTDNGTLAAVIPTGMPGVVPPGGSNTIGRGNARADELCVAPPIGSLSPGLVMIANDADAPFPFLSIIPTDGNGGAIPNVVSQKITIPFAGGIEQCQFDATQGPTGTFYVNLPSTSIGSGNGAVMTFTRSTTHPGQVDPGGFFDIANGNCITPQGMAIGPRQGGSNGAFNPFNSDILLACNKNTAPNVNTVTVWKGAPFVITNIYQGAGGGDEAWFNDQGPAGFQGHYFIATGTPAVPGGGAMFVSVIDPLFGPANNPPGGNGFDQTIPTGFKGSAANSNHSVAAWSGTPGGLGLLEVVAIPVISTQGASPSASLLCGVDAAKGCVAFFVISPPATFPDNNATQNF